jgi:hypothetical protein
MWDNRNDSLIRIEFLGQPLSAQPCEVDMGLSIRSLRLQQKKYTFSAVISGNGAVCAYCTILFARAQRLPPPMQRPHNRLLVLLYKHGNLTRLLSVLRLCYLLV